jgi:general secretion pathway protein C
MRGTVPYLRIKYASVFVCVTLGAYILSSLALSLLESKLAPVAPKSQIRRAVARAETAVKPSIDYYKSIWENDIFSTTRGGQNDGSGPLQLDQLSLTSLNCSLVGTVVPEKGDGWAFIMDNDGNVQDIVTVGSSMKGARVVKIFKDKVVLNINGKDELLMMDMEETSKQASSVSTGGRQSQGQVHTYNVNRGLVQKSLNDLADVMSKMRVEPYFTGGKPDGFRISQIQSGSLLSSMGFQDGDVIKSVNGREIASAEDAMRLYEAMRGSSFFRVGIIRSGGPQTIQIRVR